MSGSHIPFIDGTMADYERAVNELCDQRRAAPRPAREWAGTAVICGVLLSGLFATLPSLPTNEATQDNAVRVAAANATRAAAEIRMANLGVEVVPVSATAIQRDRGPGDPRRNRI